MTGGHMRTSFKKNLAVRAGTLIALGAMLLTALLSYFFYHQTYEAELIEADKQLQQLVATVENSAAIATYLDNKELALEVCRGLARNDVVDSLVLVSENGMRVNSGEDFQEDDLTPGNGSVLHRFSLASPFEATEQVGEIIIKTNRKLIDRNARQAAEVLVLNMLAYSSAIVGMVIFLVHGQLTRPLKSLAHKLHAIKPGSDTRLRFPRDHKDDEIGQLVDDTNFLLSSVEATLNRERDLRLEVESLGRRFRLIFENSSGGIVLSDQEGRVQLFNSAFRHIVGEHRMGRLMKGETLPDMFEDTEAIREALRETPNSKAPIAMDLQLAASDLHPTLWLHGLFSMVQDEDDALLIEWIVYDVSERARREQQAIFEAGHDPLTQLLNRRAGTHRICNALNRARTEERRIALLLIDLDRFKPTRRQLTTHQEIDGFSADETAGD
jgi:PAS domain S-box-containing protein